MENAVKALEYAFAILVFGIALTTSIYLFSKARATSDTVFSQIDTKQSYTDVQLPADELTNGTIAENGRVVNVETIIPSLYRDYKENYIIEFWNSDSNGNPQQCIIKFDLNAETSTNQMWIGSNQTDLNIDVKKRLDYFINGVSLGDTATINNTSYYIQNDIAFQPGISEGDKQLIATQGLYSYLSSKGKIIEEFGYVPTTPNGKITEDISKIVIRYIIT